MKMPDSHKGSNFCATAAFHIHLQVGASFDDNMAARYTKLKLRDLVMESTNVRKYIYGSISALNAFACKIPSAPAVAAGAACFGRIVQGSEASYRIDLADHANWK
jgi:hypothetical protein